MLLILKLKSTLLRWKSGVLSCGLFILYFKINKYNDALFNI